MAEIGTVIQGKYEILKLIGKGGMSKVYLAMDQNLNKQWAVKEIEKHTWDENNEVGDLVFEDARPFSNDNMTAVCIKGKWGFIDTEGILVIPCEFEDAKTFANGMAPIKKDGKWGYIDTSGNIVVKAEFEDAYPFNSTGTAPVKQDDWFLIRLYALQ